MTDAGNPFAPAPAQVPAPVEPYVHPAQPPLSIAHLLVWTAGTAVILGAGQWWLKLSEIPALGEKFAAETFAQFNFGFNLDDMVFTADGRMLVVSGRGGKDSQVPGMVVGIEAVFPEPALLVPFAGLLFFLAARRRRAA